MELVSKFSLTLEGHLLKVRSSNYPALVAAPFSSKGLLILLPFVRPAHATFAATASATTTSDARVMAALPAAAARQTRKPDLVQVLVARSICSLRMTTAMMSD